MAAILTFRFRGLKEEKKDRRIQIFLDTHHQRYSDVHEG